MSNDRLFSVNGQPRGERKKTSLPDRQRKANEAVAGIMDQINELLAEAEKLLKLEALPPMEDGASVTYRTDEGDNYEWEFNSCIGFVKYEDHRHPSTWRICHRSYDSHISGERRNDTGWRPLADCPRRLRIRVVSDFPKLLLQLYEKIVKDTEDSVPTAGEARASLEQAIASLKVALGQA